MDPDYSVIGFFFQTSFERRMTMFSSKKIKLPRAVSPHRQLDCQKEENAQRAMAAATHFEVTHKR